NDRAGKAATSRRKGWTAGDMRIGRPVQMVGAEIHDVRPEGSMRLQGSIEEDRIPRKSRWIGGIPDVDSVEISATITTVAANEIPKPDAAGRVFGRPREGSTRVEVGMKHPGRASLIDDGLSAVPSIDSVPSRRRDDCRIVQIRSVV